MVWALAVTETISYGVLYYSLAAFLLPMQHSLGLSQTTLTGAFSFSVLVTGAAAVPAGAWLDCCGARGLMTAGSLLAACCVLVWARVGDLAGLYLAFAGIGLEGAAVLYEPAFATVNAYFVAQRQKALLTVTMVAGLASTIFLPASAFLISRLGWTAERDPGINGNRRGGISPDCRRPARRERNLHAGVRRCCLLLALRGAAPHRRGSRPPPGPGSAQGSPVATRAIGSWHQETAARRGARRPTRSAS